jgi:site-specific recombinase XerD
MNGKQTMRGVFERPKGSGIWWINFYDKDGVRHREKIGRESVAREAYIQRRIEVKEGKFLEPRSAAGVTFKEIAAERMTAKKPTLAPRSYETDEIRLKYLDAELGTLEARAITPKKLDEVLAKIADGGGSPGTVNRYRSLLSSIFSVAKRNGRLTENPLADVGRRREPAGRVRFLSHDEEKRLRRAVRAEGRDHEAEFTLALNTGMRRREQFDLTWANVDLDRKVLGVTGKTGRRFIQINEAATEALLVLHKCSNGSPHVAPAGAKKERTKTPPRFWFDAAVRKSKVADFKWHDLRHTFASRLVMAGVDLRTVQELLGHRSILMTMKYAHLSQEHRQSAVEKLDSWHQDGTRKTGRTRKIIQMA